jgi:hypothetical protein
MQIAIAPFKDCINVEQPKAFFGLGFVFFAS